MHRFQPMSFAATEEITPVGRTVAARRTRSMAAVAQSMRDEDLATVDWIDPLTGKPGRTAAPRIVDTVSDMAAARTPSSRRGLSAIQDHAALRGAPVVRQEQYAREPERMPSGLEVALAQERARQRHIRLVGAMHAHEYAKSQSEQLYMNGEFFEERARSHPDPLRAMELARAAMPNTPVTQDSVSSVMAPGMSREAKAVLAMASGKTMPDPDRQIRMDALLGADASRVTPVVAGRTIVRPVDSESRVGVQVDPLGVHGRGPETRIFMRGHSGGPHRSSGRFEQADRGTLLSGTIAPTVPRERGVPSTRTETVTDITGALRSAQTFPVAPRTGEARRAARPEMGGRSDQPVLYSTTHSVRGTGRGGQCVSSVPESTRPDTIKSGSRITYGAVGAGAESRSRTRASTRVPTIKSSIGIFQVGAVKRVTDSAAPEVTRATLPHISSSAAATPKILSMSFDHLTRDDPIGARS